MVPPQQVIEIQVSKKQLSGVLLSPHDGDITNDNGESVYVNFHHLVQKVTTLL